MRLSAAWLLIPLSMSAWCESATQVAKPRIMFLQREIARLTVRLVGAPRKNSLVLGYDKKTFDEFAAQMHGAVVFFQNHRPNGLTVKQAVLFAAAANQLSTVAADLESQLVVFKDHRAQQQALRMQALSKVRSIKKRLQQLSAQVPWKPMPRKMRHREPELTLSALRGILKSVVELCERIERDVRKFGGVT